MALRLAHRSFKRFKSMASTGDKAKALRIIWMDLEMTGLDVNTHRILEAACIITDSDLNTVAKMPSLVIHESDEVLNNMNEWCIEHHGMSGLTEACRKSNLTLQDAETKLLSFVSEHTLPSVSPLAGNSVHADKRFIEKYMPQLAKHLHYRIIDVSTVKELCRRWYPDEFAKLPPKKNSHRALEDIEESIKELKTYRKLLFKPPGGKSPNGSSC